MRQVDARSTNPEDYQDLPRPAAVMAKEIPNQHTTGWHRHKRAQLVFASTGVLVVKTRQGAWVIPPQRAVWVPAGVEHETRAVGAVSMRTVYVSRNAARHLSQQCGVVNVSQLLRALILRAAEMPLAYDRRGAEGRVIQLILDEIRDSKALPLHLPMPNHPRLAELCGVILRDPRCRDVLDRLARRTGMSKRTAERLFLRETQLTFSRWRQQARLLAALTELASGHPVKQVAFKSGYASQSAFTSVFRQAFGTTPRRYFSVEPG